jgi:hypothetical protein
MGRILNLISLFRIKGLDDSFQKQSSTEGGVGPAKHAERLCLP